VARQHTARYPLLPLRLLRSRALVGANVAQALMVAGLFGFQFLTALYLQLVLGFGATRVGLAFLPITVAIAASSLGLSARAVHRLGARTALVAGLALILTGLLALTRVPASHGYPLVFGAMLVMGTGFGLAMPALTTLGLAGVGPADAGLASGLLNTTLQVGGALGLATLAAAAAARTAGLGGGTAALAGGYRLAFALAAVLLAAAVGAALTIPRRGTEGAQQQDVRSAASDAEPVAR
jgi:predicted MFS family arabinose efflux permease